METIAEKAFLGGKLLHRTLPVFNGPPSKDAPSLKRLLLAQGELAQFHDGVDGMRYMAFIELRQGSVRGNHYHKAKEEFVYLIRGKVLLTALDTVSRDRATLTLEAGDLVIISPGVAHAFTPIEQGEAVEFSKSRFDPADIHPLTLSQ